MVEITVAYYLGIDGGGSKTTCAVGDELRILASVTAGPSNITRVGEQRARESIHQAIGTACEAAKLSPGEISRVCIGAAGAAHAEVAAALSKITAELIHGEVEVVGDMAIALEAAFGAGPGVIVIAGTGSIVYGRDAHGKTARAGGWGYAIGDEGSAHWIGRQAVSELLHWVDERADQGPWASQPTEPSSLLAAPLFRELQTVWNSSSIQQLARTANSKPDFAALFPAVLAAADAGDDLARGVLEKAAAELARLAAIIIRRLFAEDYSSASVPVPMAMAGGVFRYSQRIRKSFSDHICAEHPRVTVNQETIEPVHGALQMARKLKS